MRAAERIARQHCLGDRDPIDGVPFFGTQVEQRDLHAGKIFRASRHHLVELTVLAQRGERRIGLRRIADGDAPLPLQLRRDPADDAFDDGRMRDDVLPLVGAGLAFIVFLDPVRLQHHAVARTDE